MALYLGQHPLHSMQITQQPLKKEMDLIKKCRTTGSGNSIKGFMQRFTGFFCVAVSVYVMSFSYQESIRNLEWGHGGGWWVCFLICILDIIQERAFPESS